MSVGRQSGTSLLLPGVAILRVLPSGDSADREASPSVEPHELHFLLKLSCSSGLVDYMPPRRFSQTVQVEICFANKRRKLEKIEIVNQQSKKLIQQIQKKSPREEYSRPTM